MTDINLKTLSPDTSLPTTGFLFGADSQASTNPSVYSTQTVATTLLGSTSLTGDTLTASAPVLNLTQTWNSGATTFTGMAFNAAGTSDANSAAASLLMDLQVNTTSKFKVSKAGAVTTTGNLAISGTFQGANYIAVQPAGFTNAIIMSDAGPYVGMALTSGGNIRWSDNASNAGSGTTDVILSRRGVGNLRFGAADAATALAQTLSVQSVVAGTSSTAGADFTLTGSQNTGAGLAGNLIVSTGFSNTVGTATVTITIATPGVITWTAHGLVTGSPVVFTTTGALPTGITAGTTYFAITSNTLGVNTFQIATSAANAAAGTAITTSGTQSGVQTATTSATVQSPLMTTTTFGPSGLTGSQTTPVLNLAQTWNTSGNATALKLNVTNTASGSASNLMDLQVGGTSQFRIDKNGNAGSTLTSFSVGYGAFTQPGLGNFTFNSSNLINTTNLSVINFGATNFTIGASNDLFLSRKGAANLQLGAADAASPVAQTLSVQSIVGGVSTDASAAAYPFTINGAQGTGTGAGGSIVFKVAPAAVGSSNAQNTLVAALTINSNQTLQAFSQNAACYAFSGSSTTGMGSRAAGVLGFYAAGSLVIDADSSRVEFINAPPRLSGVSLGFTSGFLAAVDLVLARDAANTLALKNSTNAQEFRVYETTTGPIYKALLGNRQLMKISGASFTDGAGSSAGTITNAPAVGNPTKWIPIDDNGTTRYIPAW